MADASARATPGGRNDVGLRHRSGDNSAQTKETENDKSKAPAPSAPAIREPTAIEKLFTSKEENHVFHVHKILGFSALGSFVYRLANVGAKDGNFGPNIGTLVFILHHFLLNATSFIFSIPQKRIRDGGFRIWPEYRMHSLIFTSRSLACMLLIWWEQNQALERNEEYEIISKNHYYLIDLVIVLLTCAAADFASSLVGENHSNTVRGTSYSDPYGKWFASEMQFALTAMCLTGWRRYTLHMVAVMVIQCNSFVMTLRRKNVASHEILTATYGVLLLTAVVMSAVEDEQHELILPTITVCSVAVILRMGPLHMNKYVIWTFLGLGLHVIRTYDLVQVKNNKFWFCAFAVTKATSQGLALHKRSKELKPGQDARMVYVVMASYAVHSLQLFLKYFLQQKGEVA